MKKLTIIALLLLVAITSVEAKNKVVDKSAKKIPEWVYDANDGYLVITVEATNMEEAQNRALESLAERVVSSIAMNISSTTTSSMSLKAEGGRSEENVLFNTTSRLRAANLPFLKGISQVNVKGVYWERLRDESGREWLEYSILYPFSSADLKTLQDQFDTLDKQNSDEMTSLENGLSSLSSIDDIKEGIGRIERLEEYFFDDVRLKQAAALKTRYREQYNSLALTYTVPQEGVYHIGAALAGRPIKLTTKPKAASECANNIQLRPSGDGYDLTFDTEDCLPEELNSVTVTLRIDGHRYALEIPIKKY